MPTNARFHDVRIVDRKITYPRNDRWVQNCVNGDILRVAWDNEWNYMTDVVAIFVNAADGERSNPIEITGGQCKIPSNVLLTSGRLFVTIIGYQNLEQRIITQKMERPFLVNESGDVYDTLMPEITEDVLQKVLNGANEVDAAITEALAISREAQAIIDVAHSKGFNMDGILLAIDQLAHRLTRSTGDVWVVSDTLFASPDVGSYDATDVTNAQIDITASMTGDDNETLQIGE